MFKEKIGSEPETKMLNEVIKLRNGEHLDPSQQPRVDKLADAFKKGRRDVGELLVETKNDFSVTESRLKKLQNLNDKNVPYLLLEEIAIGKNGTSKRLFGDNIPVEVKHMVDLYHQNEGDNPTGPFPMEKARTILIKALQSRLEQVNRIRETAYKDYMHFHEVDAWYTGELAKGDYSNSH